MYFAQNTTRSQFELYLSFLGEIISKGNKYYEDLMVSILKEVIGISKKTIDYTKVSNTHFNIVSILASKHAQYFSKIDSENLSLQVFKDTLSFLQQDLLEPAY